MIYTVTLNPALDIIYTADSLESEGYTYANNTQKFPGGKALNVSRMLANIGIPSIATGFLGGQSGKFIKNWFEEIASDTHFIDIKDDTRINVRLRTPQQHITIAGTYPSIPEEKITELLTYLSKLREGDIVVMGGSIPCNVDFEIYKRIAEICKANKAEFVIDIPPKQMKELLSYRPLLIKPNLDNLAKMFDLEQITNEADIIKYGLKCIELGAKNVIVSVGEEGSYLFNDNADSFRSYGVKGEEVNSFNSRDAMIGGFIGIYMRKQDVIESFRMASAAASATAFVEDLADHDLTMEIYEKTIVEKIEL